MAKDIDLTKKVSDVSPEEVSVKENKAESKAAKSDAKAKDKPAKSSKANKKPKKSIIKYFKDARSEFKKVVWPTPKSTTKNTLVVIGMCAAAALFIFGVDTLFAFLNKLILG